LLPPVTSLHRSSFEFISPARLLLHSWFRFCALGFVQDSIFIGFSGASACKPRASSFLVRFLHRSCFPFGSATCVHRTLLPDGRFLRDSDFSRCRRVFLPAQFFRPSLLLVPACCSSRASPGSSSRVCARSSKREAPARGEPLGAVVILTRSSPACLCTRGGPLVRPCLAFFQFDLYCATLRHRTLFKYQASLLVSCIQRGLLSETVFFSQLVCESLQGYASIDLESPNQKT
jgi:hypothetical protein